MQCIGLDRTSERNDGAAYITYLLPIRATVGSQVVAATELEYAQDGTVGSASCIALQCPGVPTMYGMLLFVASPNELDMYM
jgi:hypothetical protein